MTWRQAMREDTKIRSRFIRNDSRNPVIVQNKMEKKKGAKSVNLSRVVWRKKQLSFSWPCKALLVDCNITLAYEQVFFLANLLVQKLDKQTCQGKTCQNFAGRISRKKLVTENLLFVQATKFSYEYPTVLPLTIFPFPSAYHLRKIVTNRVAHTTEAELKTCEK